MSIFIRISWSRNQEKFLEEIHSNEFPGEEFPDQEIQVHEFPDKEFPRHFLTCELLFTNIHSLIRNSSRRILEEIHPGFLVKKQMNSTVVIKFMFFKKFSSRDGQALAGKMGIRTPFTGTS